MTFVRFPANLTLLTELIREKEKEGLLEEAEIIKQISPTAWQHINFMRRYDFTEGAEEINIAEIIKEIRFIPLSQLETPY